MPGIIITPGEFNPPGTPLQLVVGYPFSKVPVRTIRKWRQFNPGWVGELEPPAVPLPVVYSYFDFITGDITVGVDVETFDAGKPNFTTAGVRYVTDALYAKTAQDIGAKTYSAIGIPPFLAGSDSISIGLVEAEYGGDFAMPSNHIRVLLDFNLTLAGTGGAEVFYSLSTLDESDPGATSGTIVLAVPYPVNPASNGYINQTIDTERNVTVTLFYDGEPVDRIYLTIPITGEVSFTIVPATPGADLDIPEVDSGVTWSDTLHGLDSTAPAGTEPSIPYSGYVRESWTSEGEITLS
jgi:hypothetical protein